MTELLGNYVEVVSIKRVRLSNLRFEGIHRRREWEVFVNFWLAVSRRLSLNQRQNREDKRQGSRERKRECLSKSKWKTDEVFYNWTPFVSTFRIPLPRYPLMDSHLTSLRSRYSTGVYYSWPVTKPWIFPLCRTLFRSRKRASPFYARIIFYALCRALSSPCSVAIGSPLTLPQPRLSSLLSRLSLPLPSVPPLRRHLLAVFIA